MRGKAGEAPVPYPSLRAHTVYVSLTAKRTVFYAIASMIAFNVALGRIAFAAFASSG